jgi:hypothetical protein
MSNMSKKSLEELLQNLATDEELRKKFVSRLSDVLVEFGADEEKMSDALKQAKFMVAQPPTDDDDCVAFCGIRRDEFNYFMVREKKGK